MCSAKSNRVARLGNPNKRTVIMFLAKNFYKDTRPRLEAQSLNPTRKVLVFAWDRKSEVRKHSRLEGTEVISLHPLKLGRESRIGLVLGALLFQVILVLATARFAKKMKTRPIVHAHDFNTLIPAILLRKLRIAAALIYDCHEFSFAAYRELFNPLLGKIVQAIEENSVRQADAVITVSDPLADYLSQFGPKAHVLYNCPKESEIPTISKTDARKKLHLPSDKFIVSNIGEIRYDSTVDSLLQTFSTQLTKCPKLHLLVVGHTGPLGDKLIDESESDRNNVTIIPYVERSKALTYMVASDIVWAVYRSHGYDSWNPSLTLPWKFFDALACGVPMVVERNTLRAKLVTEFDCGWVLAGVGARNIRMLLLAISRDRELYLAKANAVRLANAKLGVKWENMSPKLVQIYDSLPALAELPGIQ